jgi:hypothetical protein
MNQPPQPPPYPPYAPPGQQQQQQQQPPGAPGGGVLDAIIPTNPLAAVSCWVGIFSVLLCGLGVVLGPIALVTGVISLKRGVIIAQSSYGKATSTVRSWIGIVSGAIGTIVSIAFIVMRLLASH